MHNVGSSAPVSIPFQGLDPVDEKKEAPAAKKEEPTKVEGFATEFFRSNFIKSIVSLAGFVAISVGTVFFKNLIDQKKEGLPAEITAVGKAVIESLASKAKEALDEACPAKPFSKEIFSAFVKWQKDREADDILYS